MTVTSPPTHAALVTDLRTLREKGLMRLRALSLPALARAAWLAGYAESESHDPPGIEGLLRDAVEALGGDDRGDAGDVARYLFGLVQGTVGRRPTDLREAAAGRMGLSSETFRKEPERRLIGRVADEILLLCRSRPAPEAGAPARMPLQGAPPDEPDGDDGPRDDLWRAWRHAQARVDEPSYVEGRYGPFTVPLGRPAAASGGRVIVQLGPIAQVRDVDVVVSSENVFLQPSRMFSPTLSGALRRAAAIRDAAGRIVRDVVADELSQWLVDNQVFGGPVAPGIVVPTSPGQLAERGVRRIYHPAVATPRAGTHGYDISAEVVLEAVRTCFAMAREELEPPAGRRRSMSLPLFGAGSGGLPPGAAFGLLWPAVRDELVADPDWDVYLTVRGTAEAAAVLHGLHESRTAGL